MKRAVIWIIINFGMAACAVFGLFYHVTWATNVIVFAVYTSTILLTVAVFSEDLKIKTRTAGRSVPKWMAVMVDVSIMLMFAGTGRFMLAGFMVWQIMCEAVIYEGAEEKPE